MGLGQRARERLVLAFGIATRAFVRLSGRDRWGRRWSVTAARRTGLCRRRATLRAGLRRLTTFRTERRRVLTMFCPGPGRGFAGARPGSLVALPAGRRTAGIHRRRARGARWWPAAIVGKLPPLGARVVGSSAARVLVEP
ncbi:hypothetical protein, partial [Nocardia carnea]|uniref:hypothetical protein n=1 Tax=Nocardia carnea TaxID=37328 RepID=UPI0024582885